MKLLIALSCALFFALPAVAGPNAGGTIILHDPNIVNCSDITDWCGINPLATCLDADTRIDGALGGIDRVFKVYAAFSGASSPRLKGITFGLEYDPANILLTAYGPCAQLELPGAGWPGNNTGTSLVWDNTQTGDLTEVYWFSGYNYYVPGPISLGPNIEQGGGFFADDSVPSILDPISGYGTLGFDQPGVLVCPPPDFGACCFQDGTCQMLSSAECQTQGGNFMGGVCEPNPCETFFGACCFYSGVCTISTQFDCAGCFLGVGIGCDPNPCPNGPGMACCFPDGHCVTVECQNECESQGGVFLGDGSSCDPNPCEPPVPTEQKTWGGIKARYR